MMIIKALTNTEKLWQPVTEYAENCSWKAGKNLAHLMTNNKFLEWERVFVALEDDKIIGYCTLSKTDCIPNVTYSPYISFIFVDEESRGKRLSEKMCLFAMSYAKEIGFDKAYLVSDHINLYEKYGFIKIDEKPAPWNPNTMETIFMCLT